MIRKVLLWLGGIVLGGAVVILITLKTVGNPPVPEGESGPAAEALTDRIEAAVRLSQWRNTGAVQFTFQRTGTKHFRDLRRRLVEVRWQKDGTDYRVQYDDTSGRFLAFANETPLRDAAARSAYEQAYKFHVNDFFWLNPFAALRAPGTIRKKVGDRALLVSYTTGGLTPGDSYLIITDADGRPERWQLWVSVLAIKGLEFTFEGWSEQKGGAMLSLAHHSRFADIMFADVATLPEYPAGEADRFAGLVAAAASAETQP